MLQDLLADGEQLEEIRLPFEPPEVQRELNGSLQDLTLATKSLDDSSSEYSSDDGESFSDDGESHRQLDFSGDNSSYFSNDDDRCKSPLFKKVKTKRSPARFISAYASDWQTKGVCNTQEYCAD